jgi:hypothetical protein
VADVNDAIGYTELIFMPQSPFAYIIFRDQRNMRRHDLVGHEGEIIGTGHSVAPLLSLLVYDTRRTGLSLLTLASLSTNPGMFEYLEELGILEIPVGKTADDLVCQVWRKLEVLNPGDVEKFQQEWHISSDEQGEIELRIKFQRQVPIYLPQIDPMCGFQENYIGLRFRSDPNRLMEVSRRGALYQLHILLVRLRCDLNDFLLNEIFGDNKNEFGLATQGFMEFYMEQIYP